ncbi:MAG: efflux RND transporter permease subunit [Opitutaceae bacterium]|nr:efflux RND transporter permease subunit [Cytophagales bacterium]
MKSIIDSIISFSLRHKFFVLIATAFLVCIGVYGYLNTAIEAFPDVTNTRIQIITQWPGRSAEEVEKYVTIPLEVEMNSIPKKTSLRSISLFGLSVMTMIFDDEVDDFTARQQVMQRMMSVSVPEGVDPEIQPPYGPTGEVFRYTLDSKSHNMRELKTLQDWVIERQLKAVPGVADVVSFGGEVKTFEIRVNPLMLSKYQLTALDVYSAISRSNINVGGDVIEKNSQSYVVRGIGTLNNIGEIENLIIKSYAEVPVLVRNVAKVVETHLPTLGYVGRDTTSNLVEGIVIMRKGENPSVVLESLKQKIDELNNDILPHDVKINPFYDRSTLIDFTTHTVTHNMLEGIALVTIIVFLFMADWRTTVIVSVIIPLSLLFAFMCMYFKGMSANLLSMGAIDFGIIIDGAVVMVEGIFVTLDHRAHKLGMTRFNKLIKSGSIRHTAVDLGTSIFFSKLIIICALLPIFAFQKVEGKMFSPLAWTLGFALLGSLLFSLTLVPVLSSMLLNRNVKEKNNPFLNFINRSTVSCYDFLSARKYISMGAALAVLAISLYSFKLLGTEFLPQLNEGAVYIRASMPLSSSLPKSVEITDRIRREIVKFDEVNKVLSQTGRPNDGTDPTGFFNIEYLVDLKPKEDWKRDLSKEELIAEMKGKLEQYQGINFNFSQPIMDNVEEAVSGVKGSMALKIYGKDLYKLEKSGEDALKILEKIPGIADAAVIGLIGQPELRIELNQEKMALYGVNTADCNSVIEMAIGGKAVSRLYEGERRFGIRIRYSPEFRSNEEDIGNLLVPTEHNTAVALKELAYIHSVTGPAFVFRENNSRFCAVKFSVRDRDLGSTIEEAQKVIGKKLTLDKGTHLEWKGEFENQIRANKRLSQMIPISIFLIFVLLFITFNNPLDPALVLLNVPFALIGGIWALFITGTNFSISAGVGFIALLGVCIQNGVILITVFKQNVNTKMPLQQAIREGVISRIRPVVMTALMASLGLLPAALSTGIGSETQKPLAIVVIGGLITSTFLTLFVFPLIVGYIYGKKFAYQHY